MKISVKILFAAIIAIGFVSCRENNTDVKHHSESGSQEDNPVNAPSTTSASDSTANGTDNAMPAQSSDTVGNNQGTTAPPAQRP